ncbi:MAG: hypothetical protein GHCLOJNM_03691 [bacterium]|nr:hypothetical protein [bacterium]
MPHALFSRGLSPYQIVLAASASESERWAAEELRRALKEIGGMELPVVDDTTERRDREIVLGWNRRAAQLLPEEPSPDPQDESFAYRSIGPSLVIWGGAERGTLYGVFSFLERELGCRFYTPSVTVRPKREAYEFDNLEHRESPGISVRNVFYFEAFDPVWAARNRVNGAMFHREQIGGVEGYWGVHTFERFVPPEEFFESHPEYFPVIEGKRSAHRAQLCLTNPDVLRIVGERLLERMRAEPEYLIYDVSQNDHRAGTCECEECARIARAEGGESGLYIGFVNQVAERVEAEFPDKYVGTLAYHFTLDPPKTVRPRANVVVRLCSHDCCFSHPFDSCPRNEKFMGYLRGWSAISPHLYIWDYVVDFDHYVMPYPNFKALQRNIRILRDHKVIGIMEQGAYSSRGGDFAELKMNLLAKLLWNPDADAERIISDFMYGYYGHAGEHIRAYFDLVQGLAGPDTHIHIRVQPTDSMYSDSFIREGERLLDLAEEAADGEEFLHRVELARLPLLYLRHMRDPQKGKQDGTLARIREIARRERVTHFEEFPRRRLADFYRDLD